MVGWSLAILIISLALLLFVLWQEFRRSNKKNVSLRLIVATVAFASLACLALPISIKRTITYNKGEVIVETKGYSVDSVSRFLKDVNKNIPVYMLDEYNALDEKNYNTLHVFGYGFSENELQELKNKNIVFHPSVINAGIISASWKQMLQTGEQLRLQGRYANNTAQKIKLVLGGLNTVLDSITIQPNTQNSFELTTVPKNVGKAVYSLTAVADDKTLEEEFIPVDIKQPDSLAVLMLAASPDFENRFLKNWLSQNAFSVTMRTAISKGKFDKAYINSSSTDIDKITTPLLDKYDVVITDASALAALSNDEQNTIQNKVEAGLGLVIKTDTVLQSAFYTSTFPLYTPQAKEQQVAVKLTGENNYNMLPIEQPVYVKEAASTQTLAADSSNQILVASSLYGQGKIVLTTINDTYSWVLAGNTVAYTSYWGNLIGKAARKKTRPINISFNQPFPRVNQQLLINIETKAGNAPSIIIGGSNIYPKQSINLPFVWQGTYWPEQAGWQTITVNNSTQDFYVHDTSDWQYVDAAEKLNSTNQYIIKQKQQADRQEPSTTSEQVPVPKYYFFILLVICCTTLWLEKKLNQ
jgi:hypothetical protein